MQVKFPYKNEVNLINKNFHDQEAKKVLSDVKFNVMTSSYQKRRYKSINLCRRIVISCTYTIVLMYP